MDGLEIFARTNSIPTTGFGGGKPFAYGNSWQYNSQSDRHSRTACWAVFFDLLNHCTLLQQHATQGKVGLGINHPLSNAKGDTKNLDLVIAKRTANQFPPKRSPQTFKALAAHYALVLSPTEQATLGALPDVHILIPTGMPILLALEAKAAMTAHGKVAKSRLMSELRDSHAIVHGHSATSIAAGFVLVNHAVKFVSTVVNKWPLPPLTGSMPVRWSIHKQPGDMRKVINEMAKMPMATGAGSSGFDCFGIGVIECQNDGSPIVVSTNSPPAPSAASPQHYDSFIHCMAHRYAMQFAHI